MAMALSKKQKGNLGLTALISGAMILVGVMIWVCVLAMQQDSVSAAQTKQQQPPQVGTSRYEQINTFHDGTVDHYCLGGEGFYFGAGAGDFAVIPNDPGCK